MPEFPPDLVTFASLVPEFDTFVPEFGALMPEFPPARDKSEWELVTFREKLGSRLP